MNRNRFRVRVTNHNERVTTYVTGHIDPERLFVITSYLEHDKKIIILEENNPIFEQKCWKMSFQDENDNLDVKVHFGLENSWGIHVSVKRSFQ